MRKTARHWCACMQRRRQGGGRRSGETKDGTNMALAGPGTEIQASLKTGRYTHSVVGIALWSRGKAWAATAVCARRGRRTGGARRLGSGSILLNVGASRTEGQAGRGAAVEGGRARAPQRTSSHGGGGGAGRWRGGACGSRHEGVGCTGAGNELAEKSFVQNERGVGKEQNGWRQEGGGGGGTGGVQGPHVKSGGAARGWGRRHPRRQNFVRGGALRVGGGAGGVQSAVRVGRVARVA